MAMGKRKRERQPAMWVTTTELPTAASHPFYRRLNQLLCEHAFDDFAEVQCAEFYSRGDGPSESAAWDLFPAAVDWLAGRSRLATSPTA